MKISRRQLRQIIAESLGSINPFAFSSSPKIHRDKTYKDAEAAAKAEDKSYFVQPKREGEGVEVIKFDISNSKVRASVDPDLTSVEDAVKDAVGKGNGGDVYVREDVPFDRPVT